MMLHPCVDESELLRDEQGHALCEFCGGLLEPWQPVEWATWYTCPDCGAVVLAVAEAVYER